jgi:hypothetical protein
MMKKKKHSKTAAELMSELQSNPAWAGAAHAREVNQRQLEGSLRVNEKPLVEDLRRAGYQIESVYDLANSKLDYSTAIPILLAHLPRPYMPRIREGIARALAVPTARSSMRILLIAFENEEDASESGPKWALGNTIDALAYDLAPDEILEIARLAMDGRHGPARSRLIYALARSESTEAASALSRLESDPKMAGHVVAALGDSRKHRT